MTDMPARFYAYGDIVGVHMKIPVKSALIPAGKSSYTRAV